MCGRIQAQLAIPLTSPCSSPNQLQQLCRPHHSIGRAVKPQHWFRRRRADERPQTRDAYQNGSWHLLPLDLPSETESNRSADKHPSVASNGAIFRQSNFSAGKGVQGSSRNVKGRRRQRHKTCLFSGDKKQPERLLRVKFRHSFPLGRPGTRIQLGALNPRQIIQQRLATRS